MTVQPKRIFSNTIYSMVHSILMPPSLEGSAGDSIIIGETLTTSVMAKGTQCHLCEATSVPFNRKSTGQGSPVLPVHRKAKPDYRILVCRVVTECQSYLEGFGIVVPTASAPYASGSYIRRMPVKAPFLLAAAHVIDAQGIGQTAFYRRCRCARIVLINSIFPKHC